MNFYLDSDFKINIKEDFYMSDTIFGLLLIGIVVFFRMSLLEFKGTPKDHLYYKKRKTKFIISSVLMGTIVASVVGILMMAYMTK